MVAIIFCWTLLLYGAGAELLLAVTPEIVEPDVTPFFTLRCSLAEHEEGNIAALAVYRRSITARQGNTTPELVAEILGTAPVTPSPGPGFEGLTVHGQISQFEAELESYLEVVLPNPSVHDLGLYTCEVTVLSEAGGFTTLVEARVTTSNAVTDRLLASVLALQDEVASFNKSLQEIHAEIDNITAVLDTEIRPAVESLAVDDKSVDETTEATPTESTVVEESKPTEEAPTEDIEKDEIEVEERPSQTSDADLRRIADGLEDLRSKLEHINETLVRMNDVITSLTEDENDARRQATTEAVPVPPELIRIYFERGNSTYFLFQTTNSTDTRRAQVVCESKELYLAEINDLDEFLDISNEISPKLEREDIILVGGEKLLGHDEFIFPHSQQVVQFFTQDYGRRTEDPKIACVALLQSIIGLTQTTVACSSEEDNYHYFLCERDSFN